MQYTVEPISEKASNFGNAFHNQFKYTVLNSNGSDTEISKLMKKFNSIVLPRAFEKYIEQIWELKVYEDDIWVITYPKCGTTWTQEAVWQICHGVDIDVKESIRQRFPFLEIQSVAAVPEKENEFGYINDLKRPRFIKTHLPLAFLPKAMWTVQPKIIYVARDAKDAAISFFHHYYNLYQYQDSKADFLDLFLKGKVEHGNYWDHLSQFYLLQEHYRDLKMIKYEDLKYDMDAVLKELCTFLNKRVSDEKLSILKQHLQFDKMKANPAINPPHLNTAVQKHRPGSDYTFLRRGQTGSHKDEMPHEFIQKFDAITRERLHSFGIYQQ